MTQETPQNPQSTIDPAVEDSASMSASSTPTPEVQAHEAESAASEAAAPEGEAAAPGGEAAASEGEAAASEGEGAEGEAAAAEGETAEGEDGKKRRRRKRKKKGASEEPVVDHKEGVLARFLGTHAHRRHVVHAFSVGEVVGGRVESVADGAIILDLFGKGMASVDVLEPREVPVLPDPPEAEAADAMESSSEEASEASPSGDEADAATDETTVDEAEAVSADAASTDGDDAASTDGDDAASTDGDDEELPAHVSLEPAPEPPAIGSVFRGRIAGVAESGHMALVNRIIDRPAAKAAIAAARDEHRRLYGLVYGFNRGGFDVILEGIRVFCPASGMSLTGIGDPHDFLGKKLEFSVPPGKTGRSIVVSRRSILERDARRQARDRMAALKPGQRLHGHVSQVREFGLLVDVGDGLEGLVHMSEVAWARGTRPLDVAKIGDEVDVQVLKVQLGNRKDRYGKLSLSIKACLPDPWDEQAKLLTIGGARKGKVTSTTDFGAFVELAPGLEGLLHISELGGQGVKHASQVVREGEELDIVVERIDRGQRRISLSRLSPADAEAIARGDIDAEKAPRSLKQGAHVTVVVERVDRHGMKVQVQGVLGKRGRGFISSRDMGDATGDGRQAMAVGTVLEVKVTGTDRDGSLRCSIRGKEQDEERSAVQAYRKEAAQQGFGTFGDLLRAKIGGGDDA